MVRIEDVVEMVQALPEVTEGESRGRRAWFVAKKSFAWERPFTKADIRRYGDEPVPEGPILGVKVEDLGEKEAVLAEGVKGIFTIPHLDGYPALLIQLDVATKRAVRDALIDSWIACAPRKLGDEFIEQSKRRR